MPWELSNTGTGANTLVKARSAVDRPKGKGFKSIRLCFSEIKVALVYPKNYDMYESILDVQRGQKLPGVKP